MIHFLLVNCLSKKLVTKVIKEIPSEYETAFSECSSSQNNLYDYSTAKVDPEVITITSGSKFCVYGNIMTASDKNFIATTKYPYQDTDNTWKFNDEQQTTTNPLFILTKYPAKLAEPYNFNHHPITMFQCADNSQECKIQVAYIQPSYYVLQETEYMKLNTGVRVRVTTKSSGEKTLYTGMVASPSIIGYIDVVQVFGPQKHNFHYKKQNDNAELTVAPFGNTDPLDGDLDPSNNLLVSISKKDALSPAQATITYKLAEDPDNDDFFFPEIDVTVSTQGGVFTKDNADTAFPYNFDPSTPTPVPEPTEEPTPVPEPTEQPSEAPTPVPEPTDKPTPDPTEQPVPDPTEKPTPDPTEKPVPDPTNAPVPEPTKEPVPDPDAQKKGLTKKQKAVIGGIVGLAVVAIIIIVVVIFIVKKKRAESTAILTDKLIEVV